MYLHGSIFSLQPVPQVFCNLCGPFRFAAGGISCQHNERHGGGKRLVSRWQGKSLKSFLFDSATRAERLSRSCATISPNSELLRLLSLKRVLYPHRQQLLFDIRLTLKVDRSSANVCIVGISVRD